MRIHRDVAARTVAAVLSVFCAVPAGATARVSATPVPEATAIHVDGELNEEVWRQARCKYKPGSTLFVVWQQGREDVADRGRFDFHRGFGGLFRAPSRNVFLVKWAYWLNL